MSVCELFASADVELYFYDELDPVDRVRVERHLRSCEPCRQRLEDLHAIRHALASRPAVDAPPTGDWSGFMCRLDQSLLQASDVSPNPSESSNLRTLQPANRRTFESAKLRPVFALAAMFALVTIGVILAARFRPVPSGVESPSTPLAVTRPAAGAPAATADREPSVRRRDRAPHCRTVPPRSR